jgi:phospholipase/carboxylesterase
VEAGVSPDPLAAVEIEPPVPARSSVVWLHGLGADGHDFAPIVPDLGVDEAAAVRFVFPHAPRIPVTINMGMIMPAWYDIREPELGSRADLDGVKRSAAAVGVLLRREIERGIPEERLVLGGFSQGGAVALYAGLRRSRPLAGLLALSTYLVGADTLDAERAVPDPLPPVFQAHGTLDPMVPVRAGEEARERLLRLGYDVTWRSYPMGHQVCMEEIRDIGTWLNHVLSG